MTSTTAQLGARAEELVSRRLERAGFRILDRNWRRPWGELDIVALRDGILHFVEVKASGRRLAGFEPSVRADAGKMRKVLRAARSWLAFRRIDPRTPWQVDVASVIMDGERPAMELLENI